MAISISLIKRPLRERRAGGQKKWRYAMRWRDPTTGKYKCETTGTADATLAKELAKVQWAKVNGLVDVPEPEQAAPEPAAKPTWGDCRDAMQRAMEADNLRPTYVADAKLTLEMLRRMFPIESPADVTPEQANEYKRRRAEANASPWSIRGDLSTLKAVFGKWLGRECGLLDPARNPFANVKAPKCDDPEVRIVSAAETEALFAWLGERWNNWRLPLTFLEVAATMGWRVTELASMKADDLLPDGHIRVSAETCKTRRHKYGWLPPDLYAALKACAADGWAFGRFADELRRLLLLWKRQPHHAAKVKDYEPRRLVGWLQDEIERFNDAREAQAAKDGTPTPERFTLHDFRRTAITGMQMAGVSEKEASVMVGATPEVIRRHYEKLDQLAIARRSVERRIGYMGAETALRLVRAGCAQGETASVDGKRDLSQTG